MRFFLDNTLKNISDIKSLKIFMIFGLNQPKQGLHFEWNIFFRKKIFSCFFCLMVPTKMAQIYFCIFLTNWLEIFLLVLEQSLRSPYVYTVYLVDLLAYLTKDQQSSIDICAKITNFKACIPEGTQSCLFEGTIFFSIGLWIYFTGRLNISFA